MKLLRQDWVRMAVVLGVVFLGALSLHMERLGGWGFLLLCFAVGSIGGFAWMCGSSYLKQKWVGLARKQKLLLVLAACVIYVVISGVKNYGAPDAGFKNFSAFLTLSLVMLLFGAYKLVSIVLDKIWFRLTHR